MMAEFVVKTLLALLLITHAGVIKSGVSREEPSCSGSGCGLVRFGRVDGCFTVENDSSEEVLLVLTGNIALVRPSERYVLRKSQIDSNEECEPAQQVAITANRLRTMGLAIVFYKEEQFSMTSGHRAPGVGYLWSPWYLVCTRFMSEGWKIVRHTVRLEGDRKTCGAWANCRKLVDTPRRVCYEFQTQGHTEHNNAVPSTAMIIDYSAVYTRPARPWVRD
jgi:hypothetical protein